MKKIFQKQRYLTIIVLPIIPIIWIIGWIFTYFSSAKIESNNQPVKNKNQIKKKYLHPKLESIN